MKSTIEEIKNRLLPSVVISRKIALKPRGNGEFIGLCPFHQEKTPSFSVVDDKGFYYCFGCGAKGDIFKFIMETQNLNYNDALDTLAKDAGVIVPKKSAKSVEAEKKLAIYERIFELTTTYYQEKLNSQHGNEAKTYLKKRGLTDEIIAKFRLGYASDNSNLLNKLKAEFAEIDIITSSVFQKDNNARLYAFFRDRIIFPIFNRKNKIIAFGGRILNDGQPKYINSPDNPLFKKSHELYCLNFAIPNLPSDRQIIIVEGYMDVITLFQAGFKNIVAPLGTALKTSQIEMLWQLQATPVLCLDNDNAGQRATLKTCKELLPHISSDKSVKIMQITGAKDPDEFLQKNGNAAFKHFLDNSLPLSEYLFYNEKNLKSLKTPEQKSHLKKRLLLVVDQIKDIDLKTQYKKYFLDNFNQFIYKKKTFENTSSSELAISSTMNYDNSDIKLILNFLLQHPVLLNNPQIMDELDRMEILCPELDKVRNHLLFVADYAIEVSSFNKKNFPPEITKIISGILENITISKVANEDDALHYLIRLFKLNTLNKLQSEIEMILNELNNNPTESNFTLFINLKKTEEQLKIELGII